MFLNERWLHLVSTHDPRVRRNSMQSFVEILNRDALEDCHSPVYPNLERQHKKNTPIRNRCIKSNHKKKENLSYTSFLLKQCPRFGFDFQNFERLRETASEPGFFQHMPPTIGFASIAVEFMNNNARKINNKRSSHRRRSTQHLPALK